MNVAELIKELNKLPKKLKVGVRAHDNSDSEISGWVSGVDEFIKSEFDINDMDYCDQGCFKSLPKKCIVLTC